MTFGSLWLFSAVVLLASWAGVAAVRRYALLRLMDQPNERRSHNRPTPRGGGIALAAVHVASVLLCGMSGLLQANLAAALVGGGLLVAAIGFVDDHGHVKASVRLLCHFVACGWAVWWLGGLPPIDFGGGPTSLGWVGMGLLILVLVWFLNLFNFMDGIDGIAGVQAVLMCALASFLLFLGESGAREALPLALLAAATVGFLIWNWPPARIFMGDVGSGYLGFAIGTLAVWTVSEGLINVWSWLILGGAFLADATVTLLARAFATGSVTEAHRSHVYQRLSRHWNAHRPVTLLFAILNLAWLGPWAVVSETWPRYGMVVAAISLAPLFLGAVLLGAGQPGDIARERRV